MPEKIADNKRINEIVLRFFGEISNLQLAWIGRFSFFFAGFKFFLAILINFSTTSSLSNSGIR